MNRDGDAQQWDAAEAAVRAERLREELTRARIELELCERKRARKGHPGSASIRSSFEDEDGFTHPDLPARSRGVPGRPVGVDGGPVEYLSRQVAGSLRSRSFRHRQSTSGFAVGFWLITFYLLLIVLAHEDPVGSDSTLQQPAPIVQTDVPGQSDS